MGVGVRERQTYIYGQKVREIDYTLLHTYLEKTHVSR